MVANRFFFFFSGENKQCACVNIYLAVPRNTRLLQMARAEHSSDVTWENLSSEGGGFLDCWHYCLYILVKNMSTPVHLSFNKTLTCALPSEALLNI